MNVVPNSNWYNVKVLTDEWYFRRLAIDPTINLIEDTNQDFDGVLWLMGSVFSHGKHFLVRSTELIEL